MSKPLHVSVLSSRGQQKIWVPLSRMREMKLEPMIYNFCIRLNDGRRVPAGPYCAIDFIDSQINQRAGGLRS